MQNENDITPNQYAILAKWAEALLDTGKRNQLINFKDYKASTLEILTPDCFTLFELANEAKKLEVFCPSLYDEKELQKIKLSREQYLTRYTKKTKKNQVLAFNADKEADKALDAIRKKTRTIEEETGINVAHLVFGFIHYSDSDSSILRWKAPILLIPIRFAKKTIDGKDIIIPSEDDIKVNPSFSFKLHNEYGIYLPEFDENESLTDYFDKIRKIATSHNWNVTEEVKLGMFSFQKINMYQDLTEHQSQILQNNNIRRLLNVREAYDVENVPESNNYVTRHDVDFTRVHNVLDADSSQLEAIEMAQHGKSFVLQGPPGTGKSQTIVNIIAECLIAGRSVLFVSEKQTALNIVYQKLQEVSLGDFCLELHNYKSRKKEVFEELLRVLDLEPNRLSKNEFDSQKLREAKEKLDAYARELNQRNPNIGCTLYQLFNRIAKFVNAPYVPFQIPDFERQSPTFLENSVECLERYKSYESTIGYNYHNNPWYGYKELDTSREKQREIEQALRTFLSFVKELQGVSRELQEKFGIFLDSVKTCRNTIAFFEMVAETNFEFPLLSTTEIIEDVECKIFQILQTNEEIKQQREIFERTQRCLSRINSEILLHQQQLQIKIQKQKEIEEELSRTFQQQQTFRLEQERTAEKIRELSKQLDSLRQRRNEKALEYAINEQRLQQLQQCKKYDQVRKTCVRELKILKQEIDNLQSQIQQKTKQRERNSQPLKKVFNDRIFTSIDGKVYYEKMKQYQSIIQCLLSFNDYKNITKEIQRYCLFECVLSFDTMVSYMGMLKNAQYLKTVVSEYQKQYKDKCAIYAKKQDKLRETLACLSEINPQNLDIAEEFSKFKKEILAIRASITEIEEAISKTNIAYQTTVQKNSNLNNSIQQFNVTNEELNRANTQMIEQAQEAENAIFNQEQRKKEVEEEISQCQCKLERLENLMKEYKSHVQLYLGTAYSSDNIDWLQLRKMVEQWKSTLQKLSVTNIFNLPICQIMESRDSFRLYSQKMKTIFQNNEPCIQILDACFEKEVFDFHTQTLGNVIHKTHGCLELLSKRNNWIDFYKLIRQMKQLKILSFVDATIENLVPAENIVAAFCREYYSQWIDYIIQKSEILRDFNRISHDLLVKSFQEMDKRQFEINRQEIRERLLSALPNTFDYNVKIIREQTNKKRNQISVRTLLEKVGKFIQSLKPCFLMSPLSVSTFLSSQAVKFDVVIFDEASQVFPQDAIGAIFRGKQLIVVGDSKQMSPSNLFTTSSNIDENEGSEEENIEDIGSYESILDLYDVILPKRQLLWHYRSRYEELIAFSNQNFYDGKLITFPSTQQTAGILGKGVDFYPVKGIFDRKSKTNKLEARTIADMVFEHINTYPERSLGVIAFSASQQELIEEYIDQKRRADKSKEWFFDSDREESFFVKNLENVQGDERDTIIFSVAYARDAEGMFRLHFGLLNCPGGERRLNVAITRAKYNLKVVSSIYSKDFDFRNSKSEGTRLLKEYLDFAEHGILTQMSKVAPNTENATFDSAFEEEVYAFLVGLGYSVDTQVGCSNFRIDLVLKHPNGGNLLAIECDGATYHSSRTARDRDRLRQEKLEQMGWKFYRIWSTDWFKNNQIEKERLLVAVKNAIMSANIKETVT